VSVEKSAAPDDIFTPRVKTPATDLSTIVLDQDGHNGGLSTGACVAHYTIDCLSDGVVLVRAVGEHSGQLDHLDDRALVGLALKLDSKDDRHHGKDTTQVDPDGTPRPSRPNVSASRQLAFSSLSAIQTLMIDCLVWCIFEVVSVEPLRPPGTPAGLGLTPLFLGLPGNAQCDLKGVDVSQRWPRH
jgi:hypothetical protein